MNKVLDMGGVLRANYNMIPCLLVGVYPIPLVLICSECVHVLLCVRFNICVLVGVSVYGAHLHPSHCPKYMRLGAVNSHSNPSFPYLTMTGWVKVCVFQRCKSPALSSGL